MIAFAVAVGLATCAVVALVAHGVRPPLPSLDDRIALVLHGVPTDQPLLRWRSRLIDRTPTSLLPDIALLGRTVGEVVTTRLLWAAVAAVAAVGLAAGVGLSALGWPVAALAGAGLGWVLALHEIRDAAAKRRRTLGLALSAWTQMAAMLIRAGMGVDQALHVAAGRGTHWTFQMLAGALTRANEQHQPVWRALGELGHTTQVAELRQLADQLHLSETVGGSPAEALLARARLLREQELADQLAAAKRAEAKQAVPLTMLSMCLVVYTVWPAMETFLNT